MNDNASNKFPAYVKYFFVLANLILTGFLLVIASNVISPLLAATIVAILLKPFSERLESLGIPRVISSFFLVILFCLLIAAFVTFFTTQIASITHDVSIVNSSFGKMISSLQYWISEWFDISLGEQFSLLNTYINNFINYIFSYFPGAVAGTASYFSKLLLFIFSLFFFLYYRSFFISFVYKLFDEKNKKRIRPTIDKIENAIKNYIVGLFIVIVTMAILSSIGLLSLGIPHAVFFAIFAAMLTIIPYVGIIIGSLVPAALALVTKDSLWYPIGIILIFSFAQFLEGNFVTPIVVGRSTNINPYIAILGLFVGGMLLGIMGVILAIPILGIVKIIFDQIDSLRPFGYLLGRAKESSKITVCISDLYHQVKTKKLFQYAKKRK